MPGYLAPKTLTGGGKGYLAPARAPQTQSGGGSSPPGLATTVVFAVVDADTGIPVTGLSNLDYAFYDQPRIKDAMAPVKKGSNLSISGGTATIDISGVTTLSPGQKGRIEWGTADGVKAGGGQVVVS